MDLVTIECTKDEALQVTGNMLGTVEPGETEEASSEASAVEDIVFESVSKVRLLLVEEAEVVIDGLLAVGMKVETRSPGEIKRRALSLS